MKGLDSKISTVSLIGSFKQHYNSIKEALAIFQGAGLRVYSPRGNTILEEGIPFVRFENDPEEWSDEKVQSIALHRIMRSDFVFVVAPDGYIGKTTSYEIGRIIEKSKPIYFSNRPEDLPIHVPDSHVCEPLYISKKIKEGAFVPKALYHEPLNEICALEKDLLNERYSGI
jgi:hypothetical protein